MGITRLVSVAILTDSTKTVGLDMALNASTFSFFNLIIFSGFVLVLVFALKVAFLFVNPSTLLSVTFEDGALSESSESRL